jgi:hypothetical protein
MIVITNELMYEVLKIQADVTSVKASVADHYAAPGSPA